MVRSLVDFANNFHFLVRFLQINLHISEKMSNFVGGFVRRTVNC